MITAERLNSIYDNFIKEYKPGHIHKLLTDYIRYLYKVDKKLWNATNLENEFGLNFQQIQNILRPEKNKLPIDRRKGERRENNG